VGHAIKIEPGSAVTLADLPTKDDGGLTKEAGAQRLDELSAELDELQELLYAAGTHALLIVLQGMDTSGKDGTIRSAFAAMDPQGVRVAGFGVPTEEELAHDFLWRIHQQAPERGMVTIFNRSHYEDVLVARVKDLVPQAVWQRRYEQINTFERLLTESDTLIAKFFLHISNEEQRERLLAREEDVTKAWKLNAGDWQERRNWDAYQAAYEDVVRNCSTNHAPWYVVPADRKWFRNLAVGETVVELLRPHREGWLESLKERGEEERAKIEELRVAGEIG
jgi:PPK2 family polyphosphate:nucleotide phosphotransferase